MPSNPSHRVSSWSQRRGVLVGLLAVVGLVTAAVAPNAGATPIARSPQQAAADGGRVIQEPIDSTNYIQLTDKAGPAEFEPAFALLQKLYPRYVQITTIAQALHDPCAVSTGPDGIPACAPGDKHDGLPLYVIILTDRDVPDAGKAYVSLTFAHDAEPCGREGTLRSVQDLLLGTKDPKEMFTDGDGLGGSATMNSSEILARTKTFITVTSPDGWAAGDGDADYSQYNGAGINSNRVAYQPGWVFSGPLLASHHYVTDTEPEGIAVTRYLLNIRKTELHGKPFTLGADLHGPLPFGLILEHDQGNDPTKLRRLNDIASRVKTAMDGVFNSYVTGTGGTIYSQAASKVAAVRSALFAALPPSATNITSLGGIGGEEQTVGNYPLQWAQYSNIWDLLDFTASSTWGGFMDSELGADSISYEINCVLNSPFVGAVQQLYQDNVRAILRTSLVYAAARATMTIPKQKVEGTIGYLEDGVRVTSQHNPVPVPKDFPGQPLLKQLTQTPYNVSQTDYFRALPEDVNARIVEVPTGPGLASRIAHLDTLVVADKRLTDLPAIRAFVARGGNLVLTDRALEDLPALGVGTPGAVEMRYGYVGYADLDHSSPYTAGLSSYARQTYDPIGLGYPVLMERDGYWECPSSLKCTSGTLNSAPIYSIAKSALPAGSTVIGTVDPPATRTTTTEGTKTNEAEIALIPRGKGRIVIFGALLPKPTDLYPHYFGLEPYTISLAGQTMLLHALDWVTPRTTHPSHSSGSSITANPAKTATNTGATTPSAGKTTITLPKAQAPQASSADTTEAAAHISPAADTATDRDLWLAGLALIALASVMAWRRRMQ